MSAGDPQQQPCFVDSNIWIYALTIQQNQQKQKTEQAESTIKVHSVIVVSTQVINEVCVNLLKKAAFTESEVRDIADDFYTQCTVIDIGKDVIRHASFLREQYRFSYWDSLIVASALAGGAAHLYTEDMHDGLVVDGRLTIVNPFT